LNFAFLSFPYDCRLIFHLVGLPAVEAHFGDVEAGAG
jgi:hypothetical protein